MAGEGGTQDDKGIKGSDMVQMSKFLNEYLRTNIPKACYTLSGKKL